MPDPLLVSRRQQHQDDLCALATELCEEISVPKPHELMGDTVERLLKPIWIMDCQGRWVLPAEQHELYPFLEGHLKGDELWKGMDYLRGKSAEYRQQAVDFLAEIGKLATGRRYAGCPIASSSKRVLPCITPWFADLVYYDAVLTAIDTREPIQEPYQLQPQGEGVVGLMINAAYIAYARDNEDLERLENAHRRLRKKWRDHPHPRQLVERYRELMEVVKVAKFRLEPNLVRQLVYRGNCERCP